MKEESLDVKSRIGYYAEMYTAYCFSKLASPQQTKKLFEEKENYKKESLLKFKNVHSNFEDVEDKIKKAESQASAIATAIYTNENCQDNSYTYSIMTVGDLKEGKADLILTKKNKTGKKVEVPISLKAYKSWTINLSNNTFTSFFRNLLFPEIEGTGNVFINNLRSAGLINSEDEKEFSRIQDLSSKYVPMKDEKGRKYANSYMNKNVYTSVKDFTIQLFNKAYKKNSKQVNKRLIELLDWNNTEIYMAISTKTQTSVLSTKASSEFKKLIDTLNKGNFIIRLEYNVKPNTNKFKMMLYDNDSNDRIVDFSIPIKEQSKLNLWLNVKPYYNN